MFQYIFQHEDVIEKLVSHIYQPAICEVAQRLLNFNRAVFIDDKNSTLAHAKVRDEEAEAIRATTVFAIIERLGPDHSLEHKLGALSILKELPNQKAINDLLTSPQSMQKVQDFLQTEDPDVKSSTFQFLSFLLTRFFPIKAKSEEKPKNFFATESRLSEDSATETEQYKISDQFFEFLTLVVMEVIPFVLRLDQ